MNATVYVLRSARNTPVPLDGHVFIDRKEGKEWIAQTYVAGEYKLVPFEAIRTRCRCPDCPGHWKLIRRVPRGEQ